MRRARMEFGAVDAIKEDCRQSRGVRLVDELGQDVRYALRLMRKTPGFTAAAVLSLALGIGANTAIFSLMDAVLLRTLPVADVDELVFLAHGASRAELRHQLQLSAVRSLRGAVRRVQRHDRVQPDRLQSGNGRRARERHRTLGQRQLPRPCSASRSRSAAASAPSGSRHRQRDDRRHQRRLLAAAVRPRPGRARSHADADGRVVTIVGVTAPEFTGLIPGRIPTSRCRLRCAPSPSPNTSTMHDTWTNLSIVARLRAGVTETAALAATDAAFQQYMSEPENGWIRKNEPDAFANAQLVPAARGSSGLRRQYETALNVLMGMVAVVLLIASVNVANLLLVRGAARAKEVAIRMCVGGGRSRLIRQFLTESLLLALCGGVLGLVVAMWGTMAIMSMFTAGSAAAARRIAERPGAVLHGGVSLLTGIVFGLVPAVRVDPRRSDAGPESRRAAARRRAALVDVASPGRVAGRAQRARARDRGAARPYPLQPEDARRRLHARQSVARHDGHQRHADPAGGARGPLCRASSSGSGRCRASDRSRGRRRRRFNLRQRAGPARAAAHRRRTIEDSAAFTNNISPEYFRHLGIRLLRGRNVHRPGSRVLAERRDRQSRRWRASRPAIAIRWA